MLAGIEVDIILFSMGIEGQALTEKAEHYQHHGEGHVSSQKPHAHLARCPFQLETVV